MRATGCLVRDMGGQGKKHRQCHTVCAQTIRGLNFCVFCGLELIRK